MLIQTIQNWLVASYNHKRTWMLPFSTFFKNVYLYQEISKYINFTVLNSSHTFHEDFEYIEIKGNFITSTGCFFPCEQKRQGINIDRVLRKSENIAHVFVPQTSTFLNAFQTSYYLFLPYIIVNYQTRLPYPTPSVLVTQALV